MIEGPPRPGGRCAHAAASHLGELRLLLFLSTGRGPPAPRRARAAVGRPAPGRLADAEPEYGLAHGGPATRTGPAASVEALDGVEEALLVPDHDDGLGPPPPWHYLQPATEQP